MSLFLRLYGDTTHRWDFVRSAFLSKFLVSILVDDFVHRLHVLEVPVFILYKFRSK